MTTHKVPVRFFDVLPAIILTVAHVLACVALLRFRQNVGQFPLASTGFSIYLLATASSVFAIFLLFVRSMRQYTAVVLQAVFMPALTSMMLALALYLTSSWGGATYIQYDPMDDAMAPLFVLFSVAVLSIAIWYKSRRFLLCGFAIQIVSAVLVLSSSRPAIFGFVVVYVIGLLTFTPATKQLAIYDNKAFGIWSASMLSALLGTFTFLMTFGQFPDNGTRLGWVSANTIVPLNAWNFLRPLALSVASLSVGVIIVGFVLGFGRIFKQI